MLNRWLRLVCGNALVLLLVFGLVTGCSVSNGASTDNEGSEDSEESAEDSEKSGDDEEAEDEDDRVPVEVVDIERGRIEEILRFSTNLEAEDEVQVFSQAARQVTGLLVEEGDEVRRGAVLIRLQNEEQTTQVARVESQLEKARREYERQQNLYDQQLISEQLYNDATYDLEQLELTLADARRELGYTEVKAPISGTITQRMVNVGDQITVNQHLFDIVDFDSIVARVYVPEKVLPRLGKGQVAHIFSDTFGSDARKGKIERIAPLVDSRSGTVKVTVSIPRSAELLPGMYVSVDLITATHEEAVLVPKRALVYDAEQVFVFRIAPGEGEDPATVERLLVDVLLEDRQNIEPVGVIEPGDRIVVAGQAGVKNGANVRVIGDPDPLAEGDEASETEAMAVEGAEG